MYDSYDEGIPLTRIIGTGLLGITMGLFGGIFSYNHEKTRESKIALGFSEIHQIEIDAQKQGRIFAEGIGRNDETGMARTYYLAGLNDLCMKVFECWNDSNSESGDVYKKFAEELKNRFDSGKKKHQYELEDLFKIVPESSVFVRKQLQTLKEIKDSCPYIYQKFDESWTERHNDNYHTEVYFETVFHTDSKGNSYTTQEMRTRQVYDDTDHYYWYHSENGEAASRSLDEILSKFPEIQIKEKVFTASKTNPDGENAAIASRKKGKEDVVLTPVQLMEIANTWRDGSTIENQIAKAYPIWNQMKNDSILWNGSKSSAKNHHYKTYSSYDSGPNEYRVAYTARDHITNLHRCIDEAIQSLDHTEKSLPELRAKINCFIEETNKGSKNYDDLGDEVVEITRELYEKNFTKGFEMERFRGWMVALCSIFSGLVGSGAGLGAGVGIEKLRERDLDKFSW
ncbi:Uncharacterised protein [uncultured archaeon]|nr:Uncharacterised protein [uncultured archaeon]